MTNEKEQCHGLFAKLLKFFKTWFKKALDKNLLGHGRSDEEQRCRWDLKSGWASSNVMGIICPPGCNRVN